MASGAVFAQDPLRVLRLVRIAAELGLQADPQTLAAAERAAPRLAEVSPERVFAELARLLRAERAVSGLELMRAVGATAVVLPELHATRGVDQSQYHHRDVYGHTLETLQRTIELQADPGAALGGGQGEALAGQHGKALAALLAQPLADGLTRGQALRWGALLHDVAKPATRAVRASDGRVTFLRHDVRGAELARELLGRLRTSVRLREHVAALVRHHLRLGFLVHEPQPLERGAVYDYLKATTPVEVEVTLLSVADRLSTRGEGSPESIRAHLQLARRMLPEALRWRVEGPPKPLIRGDELAGELQIAAGPSLRELLAALERAQYTGAVRTREQAIGFARSVRICPP
jgi:putative nucleotidyltransferase with HDIG domain